jgi:hypothetical protein
MSKKYIKKPESILVQGVDPFTFELFVSHLVNTDDKFNNSGPGIRAGMRVEEAVKKGDDLVELDESDWALLKEVAENPSKGYPALYFVGADEKPEKLYFGKRLLPFIDAINEATDTKPEPATQEEP